MDELLLNTHIVILLYNGNTKGAITAFCKDFTALKLKYNFEDLRTYITVLNLSIYNYIIHKEKISLSCCCLKNISIINACKNIFSLHSAGIEIINSYGNCSEYMIKKQENDHVKKALNYIHNHINDPLTLNIISKAININHCYLCQLFKSELGVTCSEYVSRIRIDISKDLLCNTTLPLDIIADKCGFSNVSYFCTTFKKLEGITPKKFRDIGSL